jgi:ribosomal 30S subunit maturation factor RimM
MAPVPNPQSLVPEWDDMALVGRIARPHGLRGQVVINPETTSISSLAARSKRWWAMLSEKWPRWKEAPARRGW